MSSEKGQSKIFKRIEIRLIIVFIAIVLIFVSSLTFLIINKSSNAIRDNSSKLINANSKQLQYNINSYLEKVEKTAALLFSDESYYKYDETDVVLDKYTKLQRENNLANRIADLGIMQNYSDFGIIYADNHTIGWISTVTKNLFENGELYNSISAQITNVKTHDGWFFSKNENMDRIYYVKRLNKNAVILASFYTRELSNVFELPDELSDMTIRLTDDEDRIVYSSIKDEIGSYLPETVSSLIVDENSIHISHKDYIININTCENGWHVVCEVKTDAVLSDMIALRSFAVNVALTLTAIFIGLGIIVLLRVTKYARVKVSDLEIQASYDGLSGVFNKITFETSVKKVIEKAEEDETLAFAVMDVDHFKNINDTFGHAYGDKVIIRTANVIKKVFTGDSLIGRIGGDEFAFLIDVKAFDSSDIRYEVAKKMELLSSEFLKEFSREHKSCGVSVSAGICLSKGKTYNFDELFKRSDDALYYSKEHGRNQYSFYKEGMKSE